MAEMKRRALRADNRGDDDCGGEARGQVEPVAPRDGCLAAQQRRDVHASGPRAARAAGELQCGKGGRHEQGLAAGGERRRHSWWRRSSSAVVFFFAPSCRFQQGVSSGGARRNDAER